LLPVVALFTTLAAAPSAYATAFTFSGVAANGTGSTAMSIEIVGNELTLVLTNTSPTTLNNSSGSNAPGIIAFGFDLENDPLPALTSWSLTADRHVSGAL
jgi:hypothetical protein